MRTKSPLAIETTSREGEGSYPPRFASESVVDQALIDTVRIDVAESPHRVEQDVRRLLLSQPGLHFPSLVVRRIDDGVCLQGVVEADDDTPDVCGLARSVAGVNHVLNRLLVAPRHFLPPKG